MVASRLLALLVVAASALSLSAAAPARAEKAKPAARPSGEKKDRRLASITAKGRPDVRLTRLELPGGLANAKQYQRFLRKRLSREAKRAKWGAGRNNVIEYRFTIKELSISNDGDVLRVRCTAVGRLPGGQAAKSQLSYGGDPKQPRKVVENVLAIVARGVVSRLAELERIRRGDLRRSHVRPPTVAD